MTRRRAFLRRQQERAESNKIPPLEAQDGGEPASGKTEWLSVIEKLSQIVLVVVAVFGYFYTVKPIYQKDRLEEQVAEYEGILKEQRPRVAALEGQLKTLATERDNAKRELDGLERSLVDARQEKKHLQEQTRYMQYKYYTVEGKPAVTDSEVADAQNRNFRASFLSQLKLMCGTALGLSSEIFGDFRSAKQIPKSDHYPFTQEEIATWNRSGSKLVVERAVNCVKSFGASYLQRYADDKSYRNVITETQRSLLKTIEERANKGPWVPKTTPQQIIAKHHEEIAAIERHKAAEETKVEQDYGGWENTWGTDRRAIAQQNYEVSLNNARTKAWSESFGADYAAVNSANEFSSSLNKAAANLVVGSVPGK